MKKMAYLILTLFLSLHVMAAVIVPVNGTNHQIPTAGETGWATALTTWIQDISADTLQLNSGTFYITQDLDFGPGRLITTGSFGQSATGSADDGFLRMRNTDKIMFRNAADDGNLSLGVNGSDQLEFEGASFLTSASIVDDDTFATASATTIPSSESVKEYVLNNGGAPNAAALTSSAAGNISATNVQAALEEIDSEKLPLTGGSLNGNLILQNRSYVKFEEVSGGGTEGVFMYSPLSLSSSYTLTLPENDGDAGQYLKTDGSGVLSWDTPSGGGGGSSEAGLYCKWAWDAGSNRSWFLSSTSSWTVPTEDTDMANPVNSITVLGSAAGANCLVPTTKIPAARVTNLPAGEYLLVGSFPASYDSSARCYFRLTDGTTDGEPVYTGVGASSQTTVRPRLSVVYSGTTALTFNLEMATGIGQCFVNLAQDAGIRKAVIYLYRVR